MVSSVTGADGCLELNLEIGETYRLDDALTGGGALYAPDGHARIEFNADFATTDSLRILTRSEGNRVRVSENATVDLPGSEILLAGVGDRLDVHGTLSMEQTRFDEYRAWINLDGPGSAFRNFGDVSVQSVQMWPIVSQYPIRDSPDLPGASVVNFGRLETTIKVAPGMLGQSVVNHGTLVGIWRSEPAARYQTAIEQIDFNRKLETDARLINHGLIEGDVRNVLLTNRGEIVGNVTTDGDLDGRGGHIAGRLVNEAEHALTDLRDATVGRGVDASGTLLLAGASIHGEIRTGVEDDVINARGAEQISRVVTGAGNDRIDGRDAIEFYEIEGGDGDDFYRIDGETSVVEHEDGGYDRVELWSGFFDDRNVEVVRLRGTAEGAFGNNEDNKLIGNDLDNRFYAYQGSDRVYGRGGDDRISVNWGKHAIWGGEGADVFFFSATSKSTIKDFEPGADTIHLAAWPASSFEDLEITTLKTGTVEVSSVHGAKFFVQNQERDLVAEDLTADDFVFTYL